MGLLALVGLIMLQPTGLLAHVDNIFLPEGCGSCHVGHGMAGEPMLTHSEEEFCYRCHGTEGKSSAMKSQGLLAPSADPADLEREFRKMYRHPVSEGFGHAPDERLPSLSASSVEHAECVDCHNPHQRIRPGEPQKHDVSGYSLSGQYLESTLHEYEICLKCHSSTIGSESSKDDMKTAFSLTMTSQHPVTRPSTGGKSVSLSSALGAAGTMKCSDCHTNDDRNGPRGPHGSNYRYLLSGNYDTDIYADESPFTYEFCYSCHDRSSILGDRSFPYHRMHIVGNPIEDIKGTSCRTCHSSHSSQTNPHLIDFNREAVTGEPVTGKILYNSTGRNSGECYLTCHGQVHSPGRY